MHIEQLRQARPISLKPNKQIYALDEQGSALSVLHLPDRRSLEARLRQREGLLADTKGCKGLNIPFNARVHEKDGGFILIEDMQLCSCSGPMESRIPDLLNALRSLHAGGWVHMDLQCEHLLYGGGLWQLHDFDGAMPVGRRFSEREVSWEYAPPDVLFHSRADVSDDLYAAAMMIYRMRNGGRDPFNNGRVRRYLPAPVPVPREWGREAGAFFRRALNWQRKKRFHTDEEFLEAFRRTELTWKAGEEYDQG